ncbi:SDR family NAD(P)-dependent oxidoreductase [Curtobacterium sp. MCLR17_039]|uniref:NAD(P)H-binding protein n=1 Tax=Curtobacterium sp. MCLR17_039 TaxID=2175624 RepID=UPI000DA7836B|nr:NAD(P)H-binding protein [Curtobacterium sp. MCLR17_039]PZE90257.1 SDR family NAD(P)-dependent oxidoreductase [Curtobacterium sp. MCLR17_039]
MTEVSGPGLVAIAGATGRVGRVITDGLSAAGTAVRALSRTPAAQNAGTQTTSVHIDYADPESIASAVNGADVLVISLGSSDDQAHQEIALIDAAARAGVEHVVKVSSWSWPSRMHPIDWHLQVEDHLGAVDIGYSVLRPMTFSAVIGGQAGLIKSDLWGGAAGTLPANLIDVRDVGDVATRLILSGAASGSVRRAYHLTGPDGLNMDAIAELISEAIGRTVTYTHRTPDEQRALLLSLGLPEMVVGLLVSIDVEALASGASTEKTSTVEDLLGRPARSIPDWVAENAELFR